MYINLKNNGEYSLVTNLLFYLEFNGMINKQ